MGHRWRLAAAGALALGFAAAGTAALAARPTEETKQGTNISCFAESEHMRLSVYGYYDTAGRILDGSGDLVLDESYSFAWGGSGSLADGAYSLSLAFMSEMGDPVGDLVVKGTYDPLGDPFTVDERGRDGNVQFKVTGTVQMLLVTGAVTAATGDLADLVGTELSCEGSEDDLRIWNTNPASFIYRGTSTGTWCDIDEDTVLILDVIEDTAYTVFGDGIDWNTGTATLVAEGELPVDGTSITGMLEVVEPPPLDEPDLVIVDLTIGDILDSGTDKYMSPEYAYRYDYTIYALTGTLLLPDDSEVIVDCTYETYDYWERYSTNAGQKPGGKAPINDLPEDALTLLDVASTSTRGADEAPEAPCVINYGDEQFELPFGRTVWYSLTGTGEDVTLSTEGSDFDTVLGVYEPGTLGQVACVDDSFDPETGEGSLQAALTLPTEAGTEYLIQVGGLEADWGWMQLSRQ